MATSKEIEKLIAMLELLLDIVDQYVDPGKEWCTETECTGVGEFSDRAHSLLKEIKGE